MTTFNFPTDFGIVSGYKGEDFCEFKSTKPTECIIIGMDSDNDGPYWENHDFNWADLNDLCHRLCDRNLYGVASRLDETVIDYTDSREEMKTFQAWVTNNPKKLHEVVKAALLHDIQLMVNKEMPSLNDESLGMADVAEWSKDIYSIMLETGDQFLDAFEAVAEQKGYEVV